MKDITKFEKDVHKTVKDWINLHAHFSEEAIYDLLTENMPKLKEELGPMTVETNQLYKGAIRLLILLELIKRANYAPCMYDFNFLRACFTQLQRKLDLLDFMHLRLYAMRTASDIGMRIIYNEDTLITEKDVKIDERKPKKSTKVIDGPEPPSLDDLIIN